MKDSEIEDDAALVDSFFSPGGLFADENNNNNNNNNNNRSDERSNSYDVRIDPMPPAATIARPAVLSSPLPNNPWESETAAKSQTPTNTVAAQAMDSRMASLSTGMNDPQFYQQLHLSLLPTNDIFRAKHLRLGSSDNNGNRFDHDREIHTLRTATSEDSVFRPNQTETIPIGGTSPNGNGAAIAATNRTTIPNAGIILRPPPGFRTLQAGDPANETAFLANPGRYPPGAMAANRNSNKPISTEVRMPTSNSAAIGNEPALREPAHSLRKAGNDKIGPSATNDSNAVPFPMSNILSPTITNAVDAHLRNPSVAPNNRNTTNDGVGLPPSQVSTSGQRNDCERKERMPSNPIGREMQFDGKPLASESESDPNGEGLQETPLRIAIESEAILPKPIAFVGEEYVDENGDEVDPDEEDSEENSIPSTICRSSCIESNTSSLSTFGDPDNNSDYSSNASGDSHHNNSNGFRDEGIGYDTDQAHVSRIAGIVGDGSICSGAGNAGATDKEESSSPDPSHLCSKGQTLSEAPSASVAFRRSPKGYTVYQFWRSLLAAIRSLVERVAARCRAVGTASIAAVRESSVVASARDQQERLSKRAEKLAQEFRIVWNAFVEAKEVCAALLIRLLGVTREAIQIAAKASAIVSKVSAMVLFFLLEMLKFGLIEAVEEFGGVTMCYIALCVLPEACILLMDYVTIPHWTPHVFTWTTIRSLCCLVEGGTLHETAGLSLASLVSKLFKASRLAPVPAPSSVGSPNSPLMATAAQRNLSSNREKRNEAHKIGRDKHACSFVLKMLRRMVPGFFVIEGFSSEFGSILGVSRTNRMITAYNMVLVRKCLIKSPIGWISWALQVLIATYFRSWGFLDCFIVVIGLSSIRLIRYIEAQRLEGKQTRQKNKLK
ncbi:unnamed protein product [Pseudo-nitzschia multistriata]|uniref:Uncharacterized protein n=1 Tax=Pseudo-nitzschia multistriata TaxID=183589 RepID=A0A448ZTD8_9STRA|nr:unnamed protein product [Pseudo-nitzschia multistriata]